MTGLVVKHYHELSNHSAGTNLVLSQINGRFWIVAVYEEIRACENELSECKRCRNKPATQIMGPLPQVRLHLTLTAFDQSAVDYGRQRLNRWLCAFTCLSTLAVHLEVGVGA